MNKYKKKESKDDRMTIYAKKLQQMDSKTRDMFETMLREFYYNLRRDQAQPQNPKWMELDEQYIDEVTGMMNGRSVRYWLYDIYDSVGIDKMWQAFGPCYKKNDYAPGINYFEKETGYNNLEIEF